ncbi:MAG: dynamin family protein [Streptosporangiaceae bacterium]
MLASDKSAELTALERLDELATAPDRVTLAGLRDRLHAGRLRVLVAGEAKRGKSTLVNALLGRQVLPAGVTPLTAIAATVAYGRDEGIEVSFTDGRVERFPLASLADFGTERGNAGNHRKVAEITVRVAAPVLRRGLEIVDTPGTGSVYARNTAAAEGVLATMDAAVFVLTADPPVSASERDLLSRVARMSVTTFVVLNKADYLDAAGLAEAAEFTARVAQQAAGRLVRVYPLSARSALEAGGEAGFDAFAADFLAYLDAERVTDLQLAAASHLRRLAESLLDEVRLAQRAARMPGAEAADRVAAFAARLKAVGARRTEAEDLAAGQSRRLLAGLNAAAGEEHRRLAARLAARAAELLDGEFAAASPAEIERGARARLAEMTAQAVEAWRQAQTEKLEADLCALGERLAAELEARLSVIRGAADDLLGLKLVLPGPDQHIKPDMRFFYTLDEHVDQAELLAGAVRRRLPGVLGRRLARAHVLAGVGRLADSQVGRARADLQYRLAEAARGLMSDLTRRYAESASRLTAALQTAADVRAQATAEGARRLMDLADREQALRTVLAQLGT